MTEDQFAIDGLSPVMWMRRANSIRLVSANTAAELVRMIVKDEYGQDELDRNEPLSVRAEGDEWVVTGASGPQHARPGLPAEAGAIYARISQFDGRIVDYHFLLEDKQTSSP